MNPVVVILNCEANPSTDTIEIDRAGWNRMTPAERAEFINESLEAHVANAGGYGWHIDDPDDLAAVGTATAQQAAPNVDRIVALVRQYGEVRADGKTGTGLLAAIQRELTA